MKRFLLPILCLVTAFANGQYTPMLNDGIIPAHFLYSPTEKYESSVLPGSAYRKRDARLTEMNFFNSTHYWVNDLLVSGNVVFGNEVDAYVRDVLNRIIEMNGLKVKVQIHPIKSAYYNAFSTDLGYIFVNLGLIAKTRNEAELAFVLSHELAHYIYSHNLKGVQKTYELEKDRSAGASYARILQKHSYSRALELEADSIGFDYYVSAGYDPKAAVKGFEILEDTRLVPEGTQLPMFDAFLSDLKAIEPLVVDSLEAEITQALDRDDSLQTHPAATARKRRLAERSSTINEGNIYLVSEARFHRAKRQARLECARVSFMEKNFLEAAYFTQEVLDETGDKEYADIAFLRSMIGLLASKIYDPVFNARENLMPALSEIHLSDSSVYLPMLTYFLGADSLAIVNRIEKEFLSLEKEYPKSERLARLKNWFMGWSYHEILYEFEDYESLLEETELAENALNNGKKFYVDPWYLYVDFRKKYKVQFKQTERNKFNIYEKVRRKNKRKGVYAFFSASDKEHLTTDVINSIALIKDRVREMNAISGWTKLPAIELDQIRAFCEQHDRSVVRYSYGLHYKENHNPGSIAAYYYYIFTAPIAIIMANSAKNRAFFDYADFDLITGEQTTFSELNSRLGLVRKVFFKHR
ncbi:MAG: M48 family metallopeptidase [Cryomorphaceae bacterium]